MTQQKLLYALIIRGICTVTVMSVGGPMLAQELEQQQSRTGGPSYDELPAVSSFEELTAPQIDLDLIPQTNLPPTSPETTASITPRSAVKEQPSAKGDRTAPLVKRKLTPKTMPVLERPPAVKANVAAKPAIKVPVPAHKPKAPVFSDNTVASPVLVNDTDVITSTLEQIPVVGVELTPEDETPPEIRQRVFEDIDRR